MACWLWLPEVQVDEGGQGGRLGWRQVGEGRRGRGWGGAGGDRRPGQPAAFHPGDGNGRALADNAFDIAVAVLAGSPIGTTPAPRQATSAFPYLSPTQPATLPALVDLYSRQPQAAGQ